METNCEEDFLMFLHGGEHFTGQVTGAGRRLSLICFSLSQRFLFLLLLLIDFLAVRPGLLGLLLLSLRGGSESLRLLGLLADNSE